VQNVFKNSLSLLELGLAKAQGCAPVLNPSDFPYRMGSYVVSGNQGTNTLARRRFVRCHFNYSQLLKTVSAIFPQGL